MRVAKSIVGIGLTLILTYGTAQSAEPNPDHGWQSRPQKAPCPPPTQYPCVQPTLPGTAPSTTTTPDATGQQPAVQPPADLAQAAPTPEAGPGEGGSFNAQMFGDLFGYVGTQVVTNAQGVTRAVKVPIGSVGAYKISENESPRPVDRVFITYNYYNDVFGSLNPGFPGLNLHREVLGFEKTFLNGNASVGLRLPWFQLTGASDIENSAIGDLTIVTKYAWINDRCTGDVFSTGLCITVPTGEKFFDDVFGAPISSTFLQPWAGFIVNPSRSVFLLGFMAVVVPTDNDIPTLLTNDFGIGYFLRRNDRCAMINSIVPTMEIHVTNPLNHRGSESLPVGFPDVVDMTYGIHFFANAGWGISAAIGHPLTGPKPFDLECLVQFNFRF